MTVKDNAEHLRTPMQKADFTISHLTTNNGELLPGKAKKFIQLAIKKAKMFPLMNVYGIAQQKQKLNKIRFADRVLKAGASGVALAQGDRVRPNMSEVELDSQMFKMEVLIDEEVFEDNIEGPGLRNTIMQMLGGAIARDMEWIVINGDTTSTDPALAKLDGIIQQTTSHTVDAADTNVTVDMLQSVKTALPTEYRDDPRDQRFFTNYRVEDEFGKIAADRATPLGDKYFDEHPGPRYDMTPVMGIPEWPITNPTANRTWALFTHPKNVHVGIHSKIKLRVTEDEQAGTVIIVGKVRFDCKYENEDAAVLLYDVKTGA